MARVVIGVNVPFDYVEPASTLSAKERQAKQRKSQALRAKAAEAYWLDKAKDGDLQAVMSLILVASDLIKVGVPFPPAFAEYISTALFKIYVGTNADQAFGIQKARGQKDTRYARLRAPAIANGVELLRHHTGMTAEEACSIAAEKFNIDEGTAKKDWLKHRKESLASIEHHASLFGRVRPVTWKLADIRTEPFVVRKRSKEDQELLDSIMERLFPSS